MAPRLTLALAVGALACLTFAGCAEEPVATAPVPPAEYVDAVERLLDPPARLAAAVAEREAAPDGPPLPRRRLDRVLRDAREHLDELRALPLGHAVLRRQRDRLADAYARLLPRMDALADALAADDPTGLRAAASPFLDALEALPSAAEPSR